MSEIEVPIEAVQENIHHAAHHASDSERKFMNTGAILAAILAAAAAVAALFAGHLANEAVLEQIQASDKWAYFQAKGIKASIAELKATTHDSPELKEKIATYKEEQAELQKEATELEHESHAHLKSHEALAASVTFFQLAIAITAIAVLTRKKSFFLGSAGLGVLGLIWILKGLVFS